MTGQISSVEPMRIMVQNLLFMKTNLSADRWQVQAISSVIFPVYIYGQITKLVHIRTKKFDVRNKDLSTTHNFLTLLNQHYFSSV